ncbi:V-set domain-containing T-cell activation inhibitor 1-like isoform X2 [Acanthopagrus latus]|uniref:V-set domain-containing T-cell activation inhibitor 1-like isoform X2 n=1 Tax=Acanthopagrus latus TaxID=8177 RepID=UPI00187BF3CC|nr:V-set domain-containing T-cell activation inhibitor 1-like isoform X2 [Acanthopagrus latus]
MELLPLVCLCLLSCSGDAVRVVVEEDSDAVLPCLISTEEDISGELFDWKKDGQEEVFLYDAGIHYNNSVPGQDDQFKGRVSVFQDQLQNGDASIKITRTKMVDSGTYSCDFPRRPWIQTSIIELVVARVRVVVKEDSDAVLNCLIRTKEDISGKLFHWSKDGQNVFLYDAGIHSQGEQFKGRVSFFQDQLQNGNASIKITRTKMADSGIYSCDFPRHQPSQTSIIELVVGRVLRDRTGENIPGAAPEPCIRTLADSNLWSLLQCEAHGDPRPTIKWQDSDNKTLPAEETKISERRGRFYTTVNTTVTKTDNYRCVATQETLSHQIAAVTSVHIQVPPPDPGSSAGLFIGGVVCSLLVAAVVYHFKDRIRQICALCSRPNRANGPTDTSERPSNLELLSVPDPAELIENHSAPV